MIDSLRLVVVALFVALASAAHADATKVEVDLMCPIVEVAPDANPTQPRIIKIARGADEGVVVGARGDVYAGNVDGSSGIDGVVARAEIIEVHAGDAVARVIAGSVVDLERVKAGAQLEVRALLPANVYRGILFQLYVTGVEFLDNARQPLVGSRELLSATSDAVEKQALAAMVQAGREVIQFTTERPEIQTRTRWKGKSVAYVLEHNDERDYLEFLRFVQDYPGKYIGRTWKISETYATWLVNFAPPSYTELWAELVALRGAARAELVRALKDSDLQTLLERRRQEFTDVPSARRAEGMTTLALLEDVVKQKYGAKAPALARAELAQLRARLLHDDTKRRGEAIVAYRAAAKAYFEAGPQNAKLDGIICLSNTAGLLETMEKDDEALATVAEVKTIIAAELPKFTDPMYASHAALAELFPTQVAARIAISRGQYQAAIDMLTPLTERAAATGARGARGREMDLLDLVARAQVKLGELDQAAAIYTRIDKRAVELGDAERRATVQFSVGDMFHASSRYAEAEAAFKRSADVAHEAHLPAAEAKALAASGQSLWSMGKYAEALQRHEVAMTLREQTGDKSGIAWQLVQVAKIQVDTGDREAARKAYERALTIYRDLGEQASEAEVHVSLGDLHLKLKRPDDAERELTVARDIYKKLKRVPLEASTLQSMARARSQMGDDDGAEKLVRASIALLAKTGDKLGAFAAELWLARILRDVGDVKGARALLERLLPKDPKSDVASWCDVMIDLGDVDIHEGLPTEAKQRADQVMQAAEGEHDVWRIMRALELYRSAYGMLGDYQAKLATSERTRALAQDSGNRPAEVDALQQMAWTLTDLGRLSEAKAAALEALKMVEQLDDPYAHAWTLNALSRVHNAFNETQAELDTLNQALVLMGSVNYRYGLAAILFNRALIYARLRDLQRALDGYDEAEKAGGKSIDVELAVALQAARGEALVLMGKLKEAEPVVRGALARARQSIPQRVPGLLAVLARLLSQLGKHDDAIAAAREVVALNGQRGDQSDHGEATLGRVLAHAGKDDEARAALETAIATARKQGGGLPWEALYELAALDAKQARRKEAIGLLKEAVQTIEADESVLGQDSQAKSHTDKVQVFRLLVKLLLAEGQVDDAFQFLERSKVAELRQIDQKAGAGEDQNTALAIELDVQSKKLQHLLDQELAQAQPNDAKVRQLDGLIDQASKRRAEFMESIDRNDALFDRYAVRPLQLEKLQQYLGDGVLVVAPVVLDDSLVVFAMTKDALTHYTTTVAPGEIDKMVTAFVREVDPKNAAGVKGKASLARVKQQAERLYQLLLKPAVDAFGRPKTLVVSPTGSLRYLPFAALYDGSQWVVEQSDVVNVTALDREKFATAAPRGSADTTIMAMVDPDGTLPAARVELAEVKKVFANIDIFQGADASSETLRHKLRVPGYEILHFATHGRLDAQNPELSSIVLADKSLSYSDIPTLAPKRTQLVVLSACQTAVLSGGSGLEIAGLAYQFQRGRVHSVLATLWEVDDNATADLMARFYQEVRSGKSYAEALATTQRALIHQDGMEHPGYWAPFVLMGSP